MKSLENITCQLTDPQHWAEHDKIHIDKLKLLIAGERVRADDVLKAGLWIVTEALRRQRTPSFQRGFLKDFLKRTSKLAGKYNLLLQCWPGVTPPSDHMIEEHKIALRVIDQLAHHAPEDPDYRFFDTSGDI